VTIYHELTLVKINTTVFSWGKMKKYLYCLAAKVVMLAQPSSAPIERVFSMLQTVVADQQGNLLQDYQAGAMMTYYNSRERAR